MSGSYDDFDFSWGGAEVKPKEVPGDVLVWKVDSVSGRRYISLVPHESPEALLYERVVLDGLSVDKRRR